MENSVTKDGFSTISAHLETQIDSVFADCRDYATVCFLRQTCDDGPHILQGTRLLVPFERVTQWYKLI